MSRACRCGRTERHAKSAHSARRITIREYNDALAHTALGWRPFNRRPRIGSRQYGYSGVKGPKRRFTNKVA